MTDPARPRRNLVHQAAEDFRPPVFRPNDSPLNRLVNGLRRLVDLQAGSIWRDLSTEMKLLQGPLLDIGCGAQIYRELVPPEVKYLGIDTEDAKERFGYQVPNTRYFAGEDWGLAESSFAAALCTEVLEHVADPAAFLARTWRVLQPGGRLLLTVPFAARWHFIPFDYWRYTPSGLQILLAKAGFSEIRVQARGNPLTVACYKTMALIIMLLMPAGSTGFRGLKILVGLLLLPPLGVLAVIGTWSLRADWGEDCLGYTVTARKPA